MFFNGALQFLKLFRPSVFAFLAKFSGKLTSRKSASFNPYTNLVFTLNIAGKLTSIDLNTNSISSSVWRGNWGHVTYSPTGPGRQPRATLFWTEEITHQQTKATSAMINKVYSFFLFLTLSHSSLHLAEKLRSRNLNSWNFPTTFSKQIY